MEDIQALTNWLNRKGINPLEAKEELKEIHRQKSLEYKTFKQDFSGKRLRAGVLGDTHFGNKWTDKKFLEAVFKEFKNQSVDVVYHIGDFTDGPWQRHHNVLEQYAHGIENQVQDFVNDYPSINGVKTMAIQGNHDDWYLRMGAGCVGKQIAAKRPDVIYLGEDEARIEIGKINLMFSHPEDGSAYAYSYKPQKALESMFTMQEGMPDFLFIGHYHKLLTMNRGGVNILMTGTTCRQTPWMRGKKIAADMGAYILDIYKGQDGKLAKLTTTLLPYYGDKHTPCVK